MIIQWINPAKKPRPSGRGDSLSLMWCCIWKTQISEGNPLHQKHGGFLFFIKNLFSKTNRTNNHIFIYFWITSLIAIYTHVFMDYITSFGTMFMWPLNNNRYEFASVFIIDITLSSIAFFGLILAMFTKQKNKIAILSYLLGFLYIDIAYYYKFKAEQHFQQELLANNIFIKDINALPAPGSLFNWSVIASDYKENKLYKKNISLIKEESSFELPRAKARGFLFHRKQPWTS